MPAPPGLLKVLDSLNIRYLFLAGLAPDLESWRAAAPTRHLPALVFPCDSGRAPVSGQPCGDASNDLPDLTWLRGELEAGRIRGFGELLPQFVGMSPADPRLDPYWALAEEFDIPVGIHMGFGPRGAAYETSAAPLKAPLFRMAASDPMLLEDVLLRHKRLRLFVMHAGWPRLESMMALLYAHPGVYVDIAGLQLERAIPRAEYDRYLRGLVQAGFGKRIMFGSDFADQFHAGIEAVMRADYLTAEQKSDILCGNAARFLRLEPEICDP
jgi:predicted TIM-barrel fold metal-dependent hydrolase